MTRVAVRRTKKPKAPNLVLSRGAWETIAKVVEGDVLENIKRQEQPEGGTIKRNAPGTRARKRAQGKPQLSLVDEQHRLVRGSFGSYAPTYGQNSVEVRPANAEVRRLMESLRARGYIFFGLSKRGRAAIRAVVRAEIQRAIRAVRG